MRELVLAVIFLALSCEVGAQGLRGNRRRQKMDNIENGKQMMNAVTVRYPLHFFDATEDKRDWRLPAHFDEEFVLHNKDEKPWLHLSRAQDQEDVWLYENWFYGMTEGVIMESGALNGILFSNSFMLEYFANWTAIHVEADPENYQGLQGNRVNAINIHGALCSEPQLLHYSNLGVVPVRGFIEFMSPSFIKKWHGKIYNNKTRIEDLPTVQCMTVKSLLRQLTVKHIDIWILDTEGAEESVLRGTNFNEVHFNAVAMECDDHDVEKNKRKTDILEANNFKCQLVERNCMCKHNDYQPSSAPELTTLKMWDGNTWKKSYSAKAVI